VRSVSPGLSRCQVPRLASRATQQLLTDGINVNITLLFSQRSHERVMEAYLDALEARVSRGEPIDQIASVASFFVSRVDTLVDQLLGERIEAARENADTAAQERLGGLLERRRSRMRG